MLPLSQTFLYGVYDSHLNISPNIKRLASGLFKINKSFFDEQFLIIQKRFKYALTGKVLEDIANENIVFCYDKENLNLPKLYSLVLAKNKLDRPVSYIALTNFASEDKENNSYRIDPRTLFALCHSATIMRASYIKWSTISNSSSIAETGATIYARILASTLDKMISTSTNEFKTDVTYYVFSKFFLIYMLGRINNDYTNSIAMKITPNKTSANTLEGVDATLGDTAYSNIKELITNLSKIEGFKKLDFRNFLTNFIERYGDQTLFMIEYWPYFCHHIFSSMVGTNAINKSFLFENLASKDIDNFYSDLSNILRVVN